MKVKRNSSKASYAAKNAPLFCEIWFINKGKPLWKRDASEGQTSLPSCSQPQIASEENFESFQHRRNQAFHPDNLQFNSTNGTNCSGISSWVNSQPVWSEDATSSTLSSSTHRCLPHNINSSTSSSFGSGYSSAEGRVSLDSDLCSRLTEATIEAEASMDKASSELLRCKRLESEAMEVINKVTMS